MLITWGIITIYIKSSVECKQVISELEYCFESYSEFQACIKRVRLGQQLAVVGCEFDQEKPYGCIRILVLEYLAAIYS